MVSSLPRFHFILAKILILYCYEIQPLGLSHLSHFYSLTRLLSRSKTTPLKCSNWPPKIDRYKVRPVRPAILLRKLRRIGYYYLLCFMFTFSEVSCTQK